MRSVGARQDDVERVLGVRERLCYCTPEYRGGSNRNVEASEVIEKIDQ